MLELFVLGAVFGGVVKYITSVSEEDGPSAKQVGSGGDSVNLPDVADKAASPVQNDASVRVRAQTAAALRAVVANLEDGTPIPSEVKGEREKILGRVGVLLHEEPDRK